MKVEIKGSEREGSHHRPERLDRGWAMKHANNVRFWEFLNGSPVKITLKPKQRLHWHQAWPNDEGWSSETTIWEYDGDFVWRNWQNDGRDCDGYLSQSGEDICKWLFLDRGNPDPDHAEINYPKWESVSREQYDPQAIAAGY